MDLHNYEVTSDDEVTDVFCAHCSRVIATTVLRWIGNAPPEGIVLLGGGAPTLADLLTVATQHDPTHRAAPPYPSPLSRRPGPTSG